MMYVNYNILYLRSCIYYCMYLSIGVAMGNRDFSCTSKKVGLEYSLRLYLWQIFLILDCLVSMSCCASFPMPDIDAGEGSPSDKLELDVFIMDCLGFWMLLECNRPLEIRNCFPPNERTFARRPVSGSNCFTKRTAIVLFQFNSNRFFRNSGGSVLSLSLSPSSQGTELNMSSFQMCSFQVDVSCCFNQSLWSIPGQHDPRHLPISRPKYNVE